ncbi:hypothetical protein Sgou_02780 [Streptomyces gougerotii]|uniref:Uncharacterized protein n=2 Tax=Streptomyces diastaticus group TaxID=2849069 RepID=A0A8H9HFS5_9ACTN|nr:hypothetical protein Srut_26930 [Streptomyces rutgersensis]GFH71433.1 hypothetical protein Sdia_22010 [Streptomyces diastaticus subsp. diastaticus]GFH75608.1 hypothetical protein Sgou_02780 [Streptomyces gougerotii]GGU12353.1 hypothetical protein GCM10015534_13570 [Streptomyces diastaticus subsp. diastaticus]GGU59872.1 hypothetical protein GCM10010227_11630 [Streptomyces gougerotii]
MPCGGPKWPGADAAGSDGPGAGSRGGRALSRAPARVKDRAREWAGGVECVGERGVRSGDEAGIPPGFHPFGVRLGALGTLPARPQIESSRVWSA